MAKKQRKLKKSGIGPKQAAKVMEEFHAGKLRSKSGERVTSIRQAKAIAMSEGRAAEKRGVKKRTWKGKTRIRPKLKKTRKKPTRKRRKRTVGMRRRIRKAIKKL